MNKSSFAFLFLLFFSSCQSQQNRIDLSGEWGFRIDKEDIGKSQHWCDSIFDDTIVLPGSLQAQGYGDDISVQTPFVGQIVDSSWFYAQEYDQYRMPGNIKLPFMMTPAKHYVGAAWYRKEIEVPLSWKRRPVEIFFERPHWGTELYIDGDKFVSEACNSLAVPHRFFLDSLSVGGHTLMLRVDNRMLVDVGINSHSVTDHTQTNWNGVIGEMYIEAKPEVFHKGVQVFPHPENGSSEVKLFFMNTCDRDVSANISLKLKGPDGKRPVQKIEWTEIFAPGTNEIHKNIVIDEIFTWNEFSPRLYELESEIDFGTHSDAVTTRFGMRSVKRVGKQILINNSPVFFRGTLDCCIFPDTGYPSMDEQYWRKIFEQVKNYGMNHVRFHSWCPPEVAFDVADELGIYLQIETCAWALTGEGTAYDSWVFEESDRIIEEYGNHPSFMMLLAGNEPGGEKSAILLDSLVCYWKNMNDDRRLYSSASGWPYVEHADFWSTADPRIQAWGAGQNSVINSQSPGTDFDFKAVIDGSDMPVIAHETGQWCVYPHLDEVSKYDGFLKAGSYDIVSDCLEAKGMIHLKDSFEQASGRLQVLCYKADIEAALRTQGMAGFQLLGLQDYHGHGDAVIGVLDAFWDSKTYETPEHFRMFCNSVVPLARMNKMVWENTETFSAEIEIAHFGPSTAKNEKIFWNLTDTLGTSVASGHFDSDLEAGKLNEVGTITVNLASVTKPQMLCLSVSVPGLSAANEWTIWSYPAEDTGHYDDVFCTDVVNDELYDILNSGGKAILFLPKGILRPEAGGNISVGFSPIFWNSAYTSGDFS